MEKKISKKKRSHPIYLGLNVLNAKEFGNEILILFQKQLKAIEQYSEMILKFEKSMKLTPNLHITTLFIGKDSSKLKTKYYTDFKLGEQIKIEIKQLVYIPERILTAVINFPEGCGNISIENKYPHITLATGKYPAKMSNDILAVLFEKKIILAEQFDDIKIYKDVEINGEVVELFAIDLNEPVMGQTIAKNF